MTKFIAVLVSCLVAANGLAEVPASRVYEPSIESRVLVQDAQNKTFQVQSNSDLRLGGYAQFRYTYSNAGDAGTSDAYGFTVPRLHLNFTGKLEGDVNFQISPVVNSDGTFTLEDAWVNKNYGDLGIRVGQFRPFFNAELNRGDENSLAVERSVIANSFGQDFSQGVEVSYSLNSDWRVAGSFTDGWNRANTPVSAANNGYGATARIEGNVYRSGDNTIVTGAGVSWQDDFQVYTADVSATYGQFVGSIGANYFTPDQGESIQSAVGQIAYNIGEWQPFVRAEYGRGSNIEDLAIGTVGFNRYLVGRSVKWTTDVGYSLNGIDGVYNVTNTGFSNSAQDGQYVFRTQIQIVF